MAPEIVYDVLSIKSDDLGLEVIRQFVAPDPLFFSVDNRPLNDLGQRDVDLFTELGTRIHLAVADLTALAAIPAAERFDNQIVEVDSEDIIYKFDAASAATADGKHIVDTGDGPPGQWIRQHGNATAAPAGTVHHDTASAIHNQADTDDWVVADASDVKGHLDELAAKAMWVKKVSAFASLQAALTDFYASTNGAGILIVDANTSLSGSVSLAADQPLRIVASGRNRTITLVSGTLTFDVTGMERIAPVVWEGFTFTRGVTDTGSVAILDGGRMSFIDCVFVDSSTSATDSMFDWSASSTLATIELIRSSVPTPSATTGIFDISGTLGFEIYCRTFTGAGGGTEKLFKRSGGGTLDLFMLENSAIVITDWGAVPGTINIHYDGTSLFTGSGSIDVHTDVNEVSGEAAYSEEMVALVNATNTLRFFVGERLNISRGTFSVSPNTTIARDGVHIRGLHDPTGIDATVLTATMGAVGDNVFSLTGEGMIFENIVFDITGIAAHTGSIFDMSISAAEFGHHWKNCYFYAKTAVVGNAIKITSSSDGTFAMKERYKIVDCVVRGSILGAPVNFNNGFFLAHADVVRCSIAEFDDVGIETTFSVLMEDCDIDMSDTTVSTATGIEAAPPTSGSSEVRIVNNVIHGKTATATPAASIGINVRSSDAHMKGNTIDGENSATTFNPIRNGIQLTGDENTVIGNHIRDCNDDGLAVGTASFDNTVTANVIQGNGGFGVGIPVAGPDRNAYVGNNLVGNTGGAMETANKGANSRGVANITVADF